MPEADAGKKDHGLDDVIGEQAQALEHIEQADKN